MTPDERDRWWKRQFRELLDREQAGVYPRSLERRWLLLGSRTWPGRRWCVGFDVPDDIYHMLDDADIRSKDKPYAAKQWAEARRWLDG